MGNRQVLTPITTPPEAYPIAGLDLEGDGGERGFLSGALVADNVAIYTTDMHEFIHQLTSSRFSKYRIYAHNLTYDAGMMLSLFGLPLGVTMLNGRVIRAGYRTSRDRTVSFYDSLDLFARLSLDEVGRAIAFPKLPTPPLFLNEGAEVPEWYCDEHGELWCPRCYNIQDARLVKVAVENFQAWLNSMGASLGITLAGIAMNLFRARFLKEEYLTPFPVRNEFARMAYYGGRVEDIVRGQSDGVAIYDVHSLYPSVMRDYPFPHPNYLKGPFDNDDLRFIMDYEGVSHVLVEVPYMYIPPLPFRINGKLYFPYGTFEGYYTHAELRFAMQRGVKVKCIYETLISERVCHPFRTYVDELYALRQEYKRRGDSREFMVKIMLNSLYGKFGQSMDTAMRRLCPIDELFERDDTKGWDFAVIGDVPYALKPVPFAKQPPYVNVLWAAYVTSYGRIRLYNYLEQADFQVVYCDTDSLFTPLELPTSSDLGKLGQDAPHGTCIVIGPKLYLHSSLKGDRVKAKGVPRRYGRAFLEDGHVTFIKPVGILEGVRRGLNPSAWVEMTKVMRETVPKREPVGRHEETPFRPHRTAPWEASRLASLLSSSPA
jgi:DNA polymerase elongation subunit (family B)